jgi:hypothetical protein
VAKTNGEQHREAGVMGGFLQRSVSHGAEA